MSLDANDVSPFGEGCCRFQYPVQHHNPVSTCLDWYFLLLCPGVAKLLIDNRDVTV